MDTRKLIDYLPPFLREYRELAAICDVEEPEFDALYDQTDRLLDNLFIESSNNTGLTRFESIVGIESDAGATETDRKNALKAVWNLDTVYTYRKFIEILTGIQGNSEFTVSVVPGRSVSLDMNLTSRGQYEAVKTVIENIIPCNMNVVWKNVYECRTHRYMSNFTHKELAEQYH